MVSFLVTGGLMTVGTIAKSIFTDIANAIRVQNGTAKKLVPRDMASAVAALNGEVAGEEAQYTPDTGTGVISSTVFANIAQAIRDQNGEDTLYTPPEMAPAILALTWDKGVKLRALLLDDGTLEINYLDGRQTTQAGHTWTKVYYIDPAGYASNGAVPWVSEKLDITRVVIDSSVAGQGITNTDFWFLGCTGLTQVEGFESLNGITSAKQMFSNCNNLESIYCAGTFSGTGLSASMMFAYCTKLVGGTDGFVPSNTSGAGVCKVGTGGVLTNPTNDAREWCRVRLYSTGTALFSTMDAAGYSDTVLVDGHICVNAAYNAVGILPIYEERERVVEVHFDSTMSAYAKVNLNYWFYRFTALKGCFGWSSMHVASMRYAFTSCTSLVGLTLYALDCSGLSDLFYTFSTCTALERIYVDGNFVAPGLTSAGTFYNCPKLVGGAGSAYSSSAISAAYFRVDSASAKGYLTQISV